MPEGSMLIFDRNAINARRVFGEIQDLEADGSLAQRRTEIWPQVMVDRECATYTMHNKSRPLPVIGCAGASALAYVTTKADIEAKCACEDVLTVEKTEAATKTTTTKAKATEEK